MNDRRPICAIATPPGRGGIGVVRASGAGLAGLAMALCARVPTPRTATLVDFLDADGHAIDRGIVIHFPAPHSYTGEDVLELQGHGGPVVMQLLLARVLEAGAPLAMRLAAPGEFTERAFLNDKLDLAQAEAVADLIDASTAQAARSAGRSLAGEFSRRVHALRDALVELRMLVEATLDFPEEEVDFLAQADAVGRLARVRAELDATLAQARQGALLRDGLVVVLAGEPNVGKSSLLNALAGAEVAIVTDVPGTTRDRLQQRIQIEGVPVEVVDTAGLREATDAVERIGIERTWAAVERADAVLLLDDARHANEAGSRDDDAAQLLARIEARIAPAVPIVRVWNKIDLAGRPARVDAIDDRPAAVWLSAKTGEGIEGLQRALLAIAGWQGDAEGLFLARERHLVALRAASAHVEQAHANALVQGLGLELFAEELRLAQERLNEITGEFGADDLLGEIFGRFCIGK